MNPHLLAHSGPLSGSNLELRPGVTNLGREVGNSIVIADPAVSRSHARITVANLSASIEDLGSTGGTFVNDIRIVSPTVLKIGDMVRLGGSTFSFVPAASVSAMGGATATMPSRAGRRERGTAERAQPMPAPMPMIPPAQGCAPNFDQLTKDLAGCWPQLAKWLLIMLIVMIVLFVVGGIVTMAGLAGSGAMAGLGGAAGVGGAGSPDTGGATGAGSGSAAPQPPDQQNQNQKQAQGAIEIDEIKTIYLVRNGSPSAQPYLLLTWRNKGADPVIGFNGSVTLFDAQNHIVGQMKNAEFYSGSAVAPEETHKDDQATGGTQVVFDIPAKGVQPRVDHATVSPTTVTVIPSGE